MKTIDNRHVRDNINIIASVPDEDIDYSDIPASTWRGMPVIGLNTLPESEYQEAISYLSAEHAKIRQTIDVSPVLSRRPIRYAKEDMDNTVRHCASITETKETCGKPFKVSDYPVGYYPFKDQIVKGSYVDTCPICEIKSLKRLLQSPENEIATLSLKADLALLEPHHNAGMA